MEVGVLGPVRAIGDDVEIALGGPRQRRLLAVLALGARRVVALDRIVEAVWGEEERPAGASRTVLSYVSRLRAALGPGYVLTADGGYVLAGPDLVVDAERFERALHEAKLASPIEALSLLDEALGRWRGRAFGELADEQWCRPTAVRLEELRVLALETREQARLDLGQHADAVPELEQLVAEHPDRDSFQGQLMLALFRSGRQADALRSFRQHRRRLADETGLDPSRDLIGLERRIAVGDDSLQFLTIGRTARGYVLAEVIGEGAFATVYRAMQPCLQRDVAVKVVRAELADDPRYVRRFEAEARLVGRLEHGNVVPLYDFWREPGAAYLVFRYLRGGSLELQRGTGPWPLARVAPLVEQVGAALAAAHDAGIVHRDVRPANVLFDETGNGYLADFGIATDLVDPDASIGASNDPAFIYTSPEQLTHGRATPRSDQFALAVIAWDLLAGDPSGQGVLTPLGRPDVPSEVDAVLCRAAAERPEERYRSIVDFLVAWRSAVQSTPDDTVTERVEAMVNPYKGLRPFDEADARDFHGRDQAVERLVELLDEHRFVTVVGPSGSGKSSLVRAGLAPRLRAERRLVAVAVAGVDPLDAIADALAQVAVTPVGSTREQLLDPTRLASNIDAVLPTDGSDLVLVLDQFEELWTLVEPTRRDRLLAALVFAATVQGSRLRIVVTVRADFYDRPLSHPTVGPLVEAASYPLAPLGPVELEQAMSAPAARVGVALEPALTAELTAAVAAQPAGLPLLQYALTELFDQRVGTTMTVTAYDAMGGAAGALTGRAEATIAALQDAERASVPRLFRRLVAIGDGTEDTRRRVVRGELARVPSAVIDAFGAARLLTFDVDAATRRPTVEVAHESLIRHWPRLRTWLDEDRDGLRIHRHLTEAAAVWDARGRDTGDLYRGVRLQSAAGWADQHPDELTVAEASFVEQGRRRARAGRRWRVAAFGVLSVLVVAAVGAAGLAVEQRDRADRHAAAASTNAAAADANAAAAAANAAIADQRAQEATDAATREARARTESELRSLAFEAQSIATSYPDLAMLLAVEAYRRQPDATSESALYASMATQPAIRRFVNVGLPAGAVVQHMAASAGGLVAFDLGGTVVLLDTASEQLTGVTITTGGSASLAFNGSGDELATSTPAGEIRRWDPNTGREVAPVLSVQPSVTRDAPRIAYLPDGALLAADGGVLDIVPQGARMPARQLAMPGATTITAVAVNPSGTDIAVSWQSGPSLESGVLALVDPADDLTITTPPWTRGLPTALRFADDQRLYVATARVRLDGALIVFDLATGATVHTAELPSLATDVIALDDGGALAPLLTGGLARLRADGTVAPRIELRGFMPIVQLPDGTVLGLSSGRLIEVDPDEHSPIGHDVRADGQRVVGLLAGNDDHLVLRRADGAVVVDTVTLTPTGPPLITSLPMGSSTFASISSDSTYVAIATPAGVEIIDVALGRAALPPVPAGSIDPPAFSPDGRRLLIGGIDGTLRMVDVASGELIWSRSIAPEPIVGIVWSDDGALVTARRVAQETRILDAWTGADVSGPYPDLMWLTFAPGGDTALAVGAELRLVDAREGTVLRTFDGIGGLFWAGFVRDGRWINALTGSGLVELIDVATETRLGAPLRISRDAITDANAGAQSGTGIFFGPANGPVVYYDLDPTSWVETACAAAGRNLSQAEWDRYLGALGDYRTTCPQFPAGS